MSKRWKFAGSVPLRGGVTCVLVALFLLGGCIFEPRTPEPPTSGESIPYLTQLLAQNAWENLQLSLRYTDSYGWESNLHSTFRYTPDSETLSQFPSTFTDWGYEQEKAFINALYDSGVTIQADMINNDFTPPDDSGATTVTWYGVVYYVQVTSTSDNSTTKYRASADITFISDGTFWYISEWVDLQQQSDPDNEAQLLPSMGVLRGNFAS